MSQKAWSLRDRTAQSATRIADELLLAALDRLTPRVRAVILLRYWGRCTLDEIGQMYGVTRERIRQIEMKALQTLSIDPALNEANFSPTELGRNRSAVVEKYSDLLESYIREQEQRELELFDRDYAYRFGTCEACGEEFARVLGGRPRRFCSSPCRQAAYRERKQGGPGSN